MLERRSLLYPVIFFILYTIASLPFLLGMMKPAFEDKNPYALLYSFFNYPAAILLDDIIHWLTVEIWEYPTVLQLKIASFAAYAGFWSFVGLMIGFYKDYREGSNS